MGGGPCSAEGSDLLLLDLGDRYIAEAVSEKGAALLEDRAFEKSDEKSLSHAEKIRKQAEASMQPLAKKETWSRNWSGFSAIRFGKTWQRRVQLRDLHVPLPDLSLLRSLRRSIGPGRRKDQGLGFLPVPSVHPAGFGFNPRPTVKERFRQRIMHKLSYLPRSQAMTGCVGCGRCVTECPVNLDIREVMVISFRGKCTVMENPYVPVPMRIEEIIVETEDENIKTFETVFYGQG